MRAILFPCCLHWPTGPPSQPSGKSLAHPKNPVTPLELTLTQFPPVSPLFLALTKSLDLKSLVFILFQKTGGLPRARFRPRATGSHQRAWPEGPGNFRFQRTTHYLVPYRKGFRPAQFYRCPLIHPVSSSPRYARLSLRKKAPAKGSACPLAASDLSLSFPDCASRRGLSAETAPARVNQPFRGCMQGRPSCCNA
jgi:hypothetical protein